ncbi:MAG: hypothetical protein BroJett013_26190 [Alphaproteobacteria bacterium]|nr:MAG: hypothetical protein BroJett013_26190 [Alphaproteobacteria bacterium]
MKRIGIAVTAAAALGFVALGVASAQNAPHADERGWSHMMMGPMAGCPMGAGGQGMVGPYMMGPGMMGDGRMGMMQGPMMGQGAMGGGHMMGGYWGRSGSIDTQLDALRSALAIRSGQQSEWNAYVAAARADAQSMLDMHNRMMTFMGGQTATAPSWLAVHRDMMRSRADSLETLARAVDRLYAELDTQQKATFDRYGGGMCGAW